MNWRTRRRSPVHSVLVVDPSDGKSVVIGVNSYGVDVSFIMNLIGFQSFFKPRHDVAGLPDDSLD